MTVIEIDNNNTSVNMVMVRFYSYAVIVCGIVELHGCGEFNV